MNTQDSAVMLQHYRLLVRQAIVAAVIGIPLLSDMVVPWLPSVNVAYRQWLWMVIAVLVLGVMWYSGRSIYRGFFRSILTRRGDMNTLVGMGTGVAWFFSTFVVLFPSLIPPMARHVYFEVTVLLLAFVNFGHALEMRARGKTSQALQRLIGLSPKTARVMRDGLEHHVAIDTIKLNELIRLLPGEIVAVDGVVMEGDSQINESMLTGESQPLHKKAGDKLYAGTLNEMGRIVYQATGIGSDTALQRIIRLVQTAQNAKPQVSRLVDTIASVFVPCVLIAALLTAMGWFVWGPEPVAGFVLTTAIAVLVIACPCALGLATPMAVMAGVGKAAEWGVLIRTGDGLQVAATVDVVVLDKTGTITQGKPQVVDVIAHTMAPAHLMLLAAALENNSEHPIARAICAKASSESSLHVESFKAVAGQGISGYVERSFVVVGNSAFMQSQAVDYEAYQVEYEQLVSQGKTVVFVAINNKVEGLIAIADAVKSDSRAAIQLLQQQGQRVIMLTGDNQKAAAYIAQQVGISEVIANVMPDAKVMHIQTLQQQGFIVAMVGDGINDAAALSQANVGIAIGGGADVTIEAADMALMSSSLTHVADAIKISRYTLRNIKQNLFGAFIYNVLGIPIAAGVLYPWLHLLLSPLLAGLAMTLSSLTVVLNANRLRRVQRKR